MHFNKTKLIYMIKYTSWIFINNYFYTDVIYKNYVNNTNNIGSLLIVNFIHFFEKCQCMAIPIPIRMHVSV